MMHFDEFVDMLIQQRDYVKGLEREIQRLKKIEQNYYELCNPGYKERELRIALDNEIRLMSQ